ncbi:hypothetical protein ACH4UM_36400 [Streptomyces sp. NPDC020801]
MSTCRASDTSAPPQPGLGFGNVDEQAVTGGIAAISDLLTGRPWSTGP